MDSVKMVRVAGPSSNVLKCLRTIFFIAMLRGWLVRTKRIRSLCLGGAGFIVASLVIDDTLQRAASVTEGGYPHCWENLFISVQ